MSSVYLTIASEIVEPKAHQKPLLRQACWLLTWMLFSLPMHGETAHKCRKWIQDDRQWPQEGRPPKSDQMEAKILRSSKGALRAPKRDQGAPKIVQMGAKRVQESPIMVQDEAKRGPRRTQEKLQMAPGWLT